MLTIINFKVRSLDVDYLDLSWDVETDNIWDYRFVVERSESPMGPWDVVSGEFTDTFYFRDITVNRLSRQRVYHYRLRIIHQPTSEVTYSDVGYVAARANLEALEVRRLEYVLFREEIGRRCWVFPRRTFGQRCPNCWDPTLGSAVKSGCETCFDTTYVRGFLDPIEAYIQFDPTADHNESNTLQETQQKNSSARALDFPPLKPKDIIVEVENVRWRVERVTTTQRNRATLHQELVVHAVPLGDIEYKLPVRISDLMAIEPSPERNFTRPQNLSAAKEAEFLAAANSVYGYRGRS